MGAITVFVAGSGGIGSAVGLLMRQFWDKEVNLFLGDIDKATADNACDWIIHIWIQYWLGYRYFLCKYGMD